MLIGTAVLSSVPGVFSSTQDSPTVLTGVMVASLAASIVAAGQNPDIATVLTAISATTILTGALFLALGYFRLGKLARFMPYPVMGRFLAGAGWLLASSSLALMTGLPPTVAGLLEMLQPSQWIHWLPDVILGLAMFFGMRREDPEVAALLHEWIAQLLAERLLTCDRTIEALMN